MWKIISVIVVVAAILFFIWPKNDADQDAPTRQAAGISATKAQDASNPAPMSAPGIPAASSAVQPAQPAGTSAQSEEPRVIKRSTTGTIGVLPRVPPSGTAP